MKNYQIMAMLSILAVALMGLAFVCPAEDADADSVEVAKIGETSYTTLSEAIEAVGIDQTIVLQTSITLDATLVIVKDVTIDLNGYTITKKDDRALWVQQGTVKIVGNGTIVADKTEDGPSWADTSSVIRIGNGSAYAAKENTLDATLEIGEGVTISTNHAYGVTVFGADTNEMLVLKGKVTVTGASAAISGNGNDKYTPAVISIENTAQVLSENESAIYFPNKGTLDIAGELVGTSGIEMKGGETVINILEGAVITATADATTHSKNNNGLSTSGYAIAVVENTGYVGSPAFSMSTGTINGPIALVADDIVPEEKKGSITISGGTVNGPISIVSTVNDEAPKGAISITGGTFSDLSFMEFASPGDYSINADVVIDSGETFTIPEGFVICFTAGSDLNVLGSLAGEGVLMMVEDSILTIASTGGKLNSTLAYIQVKAGAIFNGLVNDGPTNIFNLVQGMLTIWHVPDTENTNEGAVYLLSDEAVATIRAPVGWMKANDSIYVTDGSVLTVSSLSVPYKGTILISEDSAMAGTENIDLHGIIMDQAGTIAVAPYGAVAKVGNGYYADFDLAVLMADIDNPVTMLKDIVLNDTLEVGSDTTIDMNGHRLSSMNVNALSIDADLTLSGSGSVQLLKDRNFVINSIVLENDASLTIGDNINFKVDNILAKEGAKINGKVVFDEFGNTAQMTDFIAGANGFTLKRGSVEISGTVIGGTIAVYGDARVTGDLTLVDTEVIVSGNSKLTIPQDMSVAVSGDSIITNNGEMDIEGQFTTIGNSALKNQGMMNIDGKLDAASLENTSSVNVNGELEVKNLDNKANADVNVYGTAKVQNSQNNGSFTAFPGAQVTGNVENSKSYVLYISVSGPSTKTVKAKGYVSFAVKALPEGTNVLIDNNWLSYDRSKGIVSGYAPEKAGTYIVKLNASIESGGNVYDAEEVTLKVIVEETEVPAEPEQVTSGSDLAKVAMVLILFVLVVFIACRYILRLF